MEPWNLQTFLSRPLLSVLGGAVTPRSLLTGLAAVAATWLLASLARRWALRLLARRGTPAGGQFAIAKVVRYAVLALGLVVALDTMGVRLEALLAASAVFAVGLGFGLQNVAQNFVSGLILLIEQPVRLGDIVRVGETLGVVTDIGLRATQIVTRDEVTIVVPNSTLITESVINHSRPTPNLRVRVEVGVAYGSDTERVQATLLAVAAAEPRVLAAPPPEVRFDSFGESSLDFSLLVWVADPREDLRISSALRFSIDRAFRAAGIHIPFPQRDVHLYREQVASPAPKERVP